MILAPRLTGSAILFAALALTVADFMLAWFRALRVSPNRIVQRKTPQPSLLQLAAGFLTDFLDTLGTGSFATTTSIFKFGRIVPDELIPGTMNVGHTLPTILEAFLYIGLIEVHFTTLVLLIASSVVGAWLGAGIVASLPRRAIQLGMSSALAVSVLFLVMAQQHWFPAEGDKLGLTGPALLFGMLGTFCFGALGTLGI